MPAKVILTVIQGPMTGQQFAFEERTTCLVGRAPDCTLRLPNDKDHSQIGRHHCLLDINPPDVRVRDFGSRNGTYLNGKLIGKRAADGSGESEFPEYDVKDSDQIRVGNTVFAVRVQAPVRCVACRAEIADEHRSAAEVAPGQFECETCRSRGAKQTKRSCVKCGRDVTAEPGADRQGDYVCARCRENPYEITTGVFGRAGGGDDFVGSIQQYELMHELGKGGMGAVYLARHRRSGEQVALKVMLPQVAPEPWAVSMFLRETEVTKSLRHHNVVRLHDSGCWEGAFFMTLEYCSGGSVDQRLRSGGGPLPVPEACDVIRQALLGLEYAHEAEVTVRLKDGSTASARGLIHRDIKPQNLFLSGSGAARVVKVGDYGLAKAFDMAGLSGQTRTGTRAGSPMFMPRQQVVNFKYAKPEVDVWAMAASLYYLLTGKPPRDFPPGRDKWQIVLQNDPVPIRTRNPSIPKRLAEVIDHALLDRPTLQIKSALELREKLEAALG